MGDPVLHLLAGPNGAGKSTYFARILGPVTHLSWVNADEIAADRWPGGGPEHAYAAARQASDLREQLIEERTSFATETVFSHSSKLELVRQAKSVGYLVTLHAILVPVDLAVARVAMRVESGGHSVPERKIRDRVSRLWTHIADAISIADESLVLDNSSASRPYRLVAHCRRGEVLGSPSWPRWAPPELRDRAPS